LFFFFSRFNIYFLDFYLRQIIALVFEKVFINSFYKYAQGFFVQNFGWLERFSVSSWSPASCFVSKSGAGSTREMGEREEGLCKYLRRN